jgi:two-component sensor histidine kinase
VFEGEEVRVNVEEEEETGGMLTVWSEGAGMHQGMFVEVRLG